MVFTDIAIVAGFVIVLDAAYDEIADIDAVPRHVRLGGRVPSVDAARTTLNSAGIAPRVACRR